jgi:hypothetical protein
MGRRGLINSEEANRYAIDVAENAHKHYYDSSGDFKQRDINTVLATLANENSGPETDALGKITTTQHNEKVILSLDGSRDHYTLGSFGVTLNEEALNLEDLEKEERVEHLAQWILITASRVRDEAEEYAEQYSME